MANPSDKEQRSDHLGWYELQSEPSDVLTWPQVLDNLLPQRPVASKDNPIEKFDGQVQLWREWDPQLECAIWNKIYLGGNGNKLEAFNQWELEFLAQLAQLKVRQTYRSVSLVREGTAIDPRLLGGHGARYLIKTKNAGPTLYDWLRMPVRSGNQSLAHWLVFPESYLTMAQSLLRALDAIHTNKYVHCDLHAGNISIPATILRSSTGTNGAEASSLNLQLNCDELTLIDFGFSINCQKKPYTTLPFAQDGYRARISPHLKNVLTMVEDQTTQRLGSGQHWHDVWLDAGFWQRLDGASPLDLIRTIDWREDLYQLGHLLADIRDGTGEAKHLGGCTIREARQSEVNALIAELPEQLMRWGNGVGTPAPQEKPHQEYINRIDAVLTSARNCGDVATTAFAINTKDYPATPTVLQQIMPRASGKPNAVLHKPETQLAPSLLGNGMKMATQICPRCGLSVGQTVLICPHCGERKDGRKIKGATTLPQNPPDMQKIIGATNFPLRPPLALPVHAGFWARAIAFLIDLLVVLLIAIPLMSIVPIYTNLIVWWLYSALMESSRWQATLGKRALGLKVTDVNGVRLFFGRASARFFSKFLSTSTLGIGFLMVAWTKNKQCLHDIVSGSLVYRRS